MADTTLHKQLLCIILPSSQYKQNYQKSPYLKVFEIPSQSWVISDLLVSRSGPIAITCQYYFSKSEEPLTFRIAFRTCIWI